MSHDDRDDLVVISDRANHAGQPHSHILGVLLIVLVVSLTVACALMRMLYYSTIDQHAYAVCMDHRH